jgi:pimeloyl-ACP methyl ester carboxylesterase
MKLCLKFITPLILFISAGCTTLIQQNPHPRQPVPLPAAVTSKVDVRNDAPIWDVQVIDNYSSKCTITDRNEKELLHFDLLKSSVNPDKKHDLIIIYNILNDPRGTVSGLISGILLDEGFDCIIVRQESFLNKKWTRPVLPNPEDQALGRYSYDEYNARLARGVGRIIHHFIPTQKHLTGRYGFVGVSMGGIHAIGAASLFPDAVLTVAIMAGGGNSELFKWSKESLVTHNKERLLTQYAERLGAKYPAKRINYAEVLYRDIEGLDFDIIRIARSIATNKVKMMISMNDTSVPTTCQWTLYHALGGPEARLFPCGHYSLALYYFSVRAQLKEWVVAAFAK